MLKTFDIGGTKIGPGRPPFILAEIGINHQGDKDIAAAMIAAAADSGAHGIKVQMFDADRLVSRAQDVDAHALFERVQFNSLEYAWLRDKARDADIAFVATPFSVEDAEQLMRLDPAAIKIASGDLTNWELLDRVGRADFPVILSTGMGSIEEIRWAKGVLMKAGCERLVILHCISLYPAPGYSLNLLNIPMLRREMQVPIGWSDHTIGNWAAIAATALGACFVEKHFTLDRLLPGDDHICSMLPDDLELLLLETAQAHVGLGEWQRKPVQEELDNRWQMRRGIYAARPLDAGHELVLGDMIALRPMVGYEARVMPDLVGAKMTHALACMSPIGPEDVEGVK